MTTPNLRIREIALTTLRDEVLVSESMNRVDTRLAGLTCVTLLSDANVLLTSSDTFNSDANHYGIRVEDPSTVLTTTRSITFPASLSGPYAFTNLTAQTLSVLVSGSASPVTVVAGSSADLFSDGTDMLLIGDDVTGAGGSVAATVFDIPFFFQGKPASGAELVRIIFTRNLVSPTNLTLSQGSSETVAATESVYSIRKNNVEFAQATFAAAAATCSFVGTSMSFGTSDILSILALSAVDATQQNIGFMLHMDRR